MNIWAKKEKLLRSGATLVELLIAVSLIGIIFTVAFQLNYFGMNTFTLSEKHSENQFEVRMPIDFITREVRYAGAMDMLYTVPTAHSDNEIYLDGGQIIYNKEGIVTLIEGTNSVSDYQFYAKKISKNIVEFTVGKAGTDIYNVTTEIAALNITEGEISGTVGVEAVGVRFTQDPAMTNVPRTITSIPTNMNATVIQYSVYTLPSTVQVTLDDGSYDYAFVSWSPSSINTSIPGTQVVTGTVSGFLTRTVPLTVTVSALGIYSVEDISTTISQGTPYVMPNLVEVTMADNSKQQVMVNWDPITIDTTTAGNKTSQGTVVGYTPKVNLTVTVMGKLPTLSAAISGNGSNVKVNVSGGTPGAEAILRNSAGTELDRKIISPAGTCIFNVFKVDYKDVIQTKAGWIDSDPVTPN